MLEQRRAEYLKAMGISLWLARSPLPNAQAPRWIPQSEASGVVADDPGAHAQSVSQRSPQAAAQLMREAFGTQGNSSQAEAHQPVATSAAQKTTLSEGVAAHAQSKATTSVSSSTLGATAGTSVGASATVETEVQTPAERSVGMAPSEPVAVQSILAETEVPGPAVTPQFQLHFVKASERGLWVCDSDSDPEVLQGFVQRVMAAWQEPVVFMNKVPGFRWPFIASRHQDQSEPVAVQALMAQWQVLRPSGAEGYTIALGEQAAHWLAKIGVTPEVCLPELNQVQSTADAKRRLWLALQALDTL